MPGYVYASPLHCPRVTSKPFREGRTQSIIGVSVHVFSRGKQQGLGPLLWFPASLVSWIGPQVCTSPRAFTLQARRRQQSQRWNRRCKPRMWAEPVLVPNECGEYKRLRHSRLFPGDLGTILYHESLPHSDAWWRRGSLFVQTILFDGHCECIHLTQGEWGIKYLLQEGVNRKESSLAEH